MKKILTFILVALAATALTSCEEGDSQKDLGFPVIYIPQAAYTGLDNSYPVPAGPLSQYRSCNCSVKDGRLDIILGVTRAGFIADKKGFSVSLGECRSETDRKLAEYEENGTPAMALPEGTFSFPSKIEVPAGESEATCMVSVDLGALAAHKAEIVDGESCKLLLLGLEITNPSAYELAESNTNVVIVIDPASENWEGQAIL